MAGRTLLVGLAHPDDEVGCAGAILAQRAQGDRVVVVWLSHGEMTEAFGDLSRAEVAEIRREHGFRAGEILGVETRFLHFHDTEIEATPAAARQVAKLLAEVRPDGLLTWGDSWGRGMRHPDHQATGKIFRDAATLCRIAKVVAPAAPHRAFCPVFTYRGAHSQVPAVVVDVEPHLETIFRLGRFYYEKLGFGDRGWIEGRLAASGAQHGLRYAEVFDAWETRPGTYPALLPAEAADEEPPHPERPGASVC